MYTLTTPITAKWFPWRRRLHCTPQVIVTKVLGVHVKVNFDSESLCTNNVVLRQEQERSNLSLTSRLAYMSSIIFLSDLFSQFYGKCSRAEFVIKFVLKSRGIFCCDQPWSLIANFISIKQENKLRSHRKIQISDLCTRQSEYNVQNYYFEHHIM